MPLYMDYHIISDITIEEVKRAHITDLEVQEQYDVKYLQFWVNEKAGTVFCLIDAPDKESCIKVHKQAHGTAGLACQIVEVEGGFYNLVMGENIKSDHGLVRHKDGSVDTGIRYVLVIDITGNTRATQSGDFDLLLLSDKPKKLVRRIIPVYNGREFRNINHDGIIAFFTDASKAVECAIEIRAQLLKRSNLAMDGSWDVTFKIGVSGGQPVTQCDQFFEKTIRQARILSLIAGKNEIVSSCFASKQSEVDLKSMKKSSIKTISAPEEKFLGNLFDITEDKISDSAFNVERLCRDIGISRPQLYRKIISATGRSPIEFMRELKMKKALSLVKEKKFNICEIAMMVGYNNPSYFSKCFQEAYGISPSRFGSGS